MAGVALTEKNLKELKTLNEELNKNLSKWPTLLDALQKSLKSSTGKTFRDNYPIGADACAQIEEIVRILQSEEKEMKTVVKNVDEFITTQTKASKSK
ncbi:MAG: hypothetical protein IKF83_04375 [Clostridia bacterium]|nr:hypothetical protein [Clostridia bacterium]